MTYIYSYESFIFLQHRNQLKEVQTVHLNAESGNFSIVEIKEILRNGKNIKRLHFEDIPNLKELPDEIENCTNLYDLDILSQETSFSISPKLRTLTKLTQVTLKGNFDVIPSMKQWKSLQILKTLVSISL